VDKKPSVEIFVLNYNGRELLAECLPSIVEASRRTAYSCELTVIDNDSRDGSVDFLNENFKNVRVIALHTNRVLCAFNDAVKESRAEFVLLLNNDLKVEVDFIDPLVDAFLMHKEAFLVASKAFTFDLERYEGSLSKMSLKAGLLRVESRFRGFGRKIDKQSFTMQAGFGAFRRDIFLRLGGFDDLYLPGTVEDSDLCFRAWKAGWACYYEPRSQVYHKGQVSFKKKFGPSRLLAINQRNLHLFFWKNISDPWYWLSYLFWYFPRLLYFLLKGRPEFLWGALEAFTYLPKAFSRRSSAYPDAGAKKLSDRAVFALSDSI